MKCTKACGCHGRDPYLYQLEADSMISNNGGHPVHAAPPGTTLAHKTMAPGVRMFVPSGWDLWTDNLIGEVDPPHHARRAVGMKKKRSLADAIKKGERPRDASKKDQLFQCTACQQFFRLADRHGASQCGPCHLYATKATPAPLPPPETST